MAFPTIPTAADGRVLTANQLNTTATRTFPDLSGLTKNAGDLLIAIVVGYQSSTGSPNNAFSGWSAGWTEFCDRQASGTTNVIGAAYKWSDGTETGAITVTQAATITGHASMILLSIPGTHPATPPEAGTAATGTGTAAPPSFNPAGWDVEETLWIAVNANGMTSGTGSWTANNSAPANYSDYIGTNPPDNSVVGQVAAAVAFRQLEAASDAPGAFAQDTSNARNTAVLFAVRPAPPPVAPGPPRALYRPSVMRAANW
jgi:hypothetical protein